MGRGLGWAGFAHAPAQRGNPMIRMESVTKIYKGSVPAVENISLDIQKGEFVFLVGPSGSGKSTILRLVTKEEDPTGGKIWVAGKDIATLSSWKVPYLRRNNALGFPT